MNDEEIDRLLDAAAAQVDRLAEEIGPDTRALLVLYDPHTGRMAMKSRNATVFQTRLLAELALGRSIADPPDAVEPEREPAKPDA